MIDLSQIVGFDWDDGNSFKSAAKHAVSQAEAEQVFADSRLLIAEDVKHSEREARYQAMGRTVRGRLLHVTFTLRNNQTRIRVISARSMSRKERAYYDQET
ncbi:MAG TPA: BrnT family toxin [Xanthobacteraceae bacterium]|nr:BrnT family toxin [Xanthobacteraceae bacterium]